VQASYPPYSPDNLGKAQTAETVVKSRLNCNVESTETHHLRSQQACLPAASAEIRHDGEDYSASEDIAMDNVPDSHYLQRDMDPDIHARQNQKSSCATHAGKLLPCVYTPLWVAIS
jgi:hypothetical protein